MKPIFVTATGTNIGKTYTTLALIEQFAKAGISVGVFKPIETGVSNIPADASKLLASCQSVNSKFSNLTTNDITSYTFELAAAPYCADTMRSINIDNILARFDKLSLLCDLLIIEGAGGLMTPITDKLNMIDLIKMFDARVLLVTPSRLGCINDSLLSMESLRSRGIDFDWCVNIHEDAKSFDVVTKPYYDAVFPNWWSVDDGLEQYIDNTIRETNAKPTKISRSDRR
jgi:dethiobiotin synthetase